ncbi:galactose-specific lectin nattectin [Dicentrarchus labrax]|uniref:C-type lectin domain-containing protein n=1 Tax=Dicentrarchus labrax TaxID=13489 RepID=A0A8C4HM55_DICLA|nr:galactose-specific lectin nattectin [Dicentrarchus labrax]
MASVLCFAVLLLISGQPLLTSAADGGASGWTSLGDRCFKYFQTPQSFAKAESDCVSNDSHLVSLRSSEELIFLRTLVYIANADIESVWTGGYNTPEDEEWKWSDGTTFPQIIWNWGERNVDTGGNCMVMNIPVSEGVYFDDLKCSEERSYVCSKNM